MNAQLTTNERNLLHDITRNNFYESGFESILWTDVLLEESRIGTSKGRGVLTSLQKKGMLVVGNPDDGREGNPTTVALTEAGIEWLKANVTDLDENGYVVVQTRQAKQETVKIPDTDWMAPDKEEVKKSSKSKKSKRVTVLAFTGMLIGEYDIAQETDKHILINVKSKSQPLIFDKKTKKQVNLDGSTPKYANKLK